jgi:hypothetical protein
MIRSQLKEIVRKTIYESELNANSLIPSELLDFIKDVYEFYKYELTYKNVLDVLKTTGTEDVRGLDFAMRRAKTGNEEDKKEAYEYVKNYIENRKNVIY